MIWKVLNCLNNLKRIDRFHSILISRLPNNLSVWTPSNMVKLIPVNVLFLIWLYVSIIALFSFTGNLFTFLHIVFGRKN
jgi:hypothetical protein